MFNQNPATIVNATFTLNTASNGSGIFNDDAAAEIDIQNTIVAGNLTCPDVEGDFNSLGNNLIGDKGIASTGFTHNVNGDQVGITGNEIDPKLSALQDNGGFTLTHLPLGGSPAIDAGDNGVGLTEDQRGYARPIDGDGDVSATIDIGAIEYATASIGAVDEFRVNDVTETGRQETIGDVDHSQRAVALADDGSYVVVWSSEGQDAAGWGVYAQRFDKFGNELTGEILVNETEAGNERWARVASDSAGNFVVTWTTDFGLSEGVYARRFDSTGTALGGEFYVNTTAFGDQQDSSIAMDAAGNFVVVWEGNGTGDSDGVFFRRYSADGTALDAAERQANLSDVGTERDASVAMSATGDFVVVWEEGGRIMFQMFASDGTPGTAKEVYTDTVSSNPDVAMDALGNFVVVYRWNDTSGRGIWAHQFDNTGTEQGSWWRVGPGNNTVNKDHANPSITMDDAGNFIVTYQTSQDGATALDIIAERYQSGAIYQDRLTVNQTVSGDQQMASIAMSNPDNFVVAFTGEDADQTGVFVRQFGTANLAPTFTSFSAPVDFTDENTEVEISFADLEFEGDEDDSDGTVGAFVVKSVASGTLRIGASAGAATAFAAGSNDTINAANNAYWTPAPGANGTLNAFAVVAEDDAGAESITPVTVAVAVAANPVVNDQGFSVDENTLDGTPVGTIAATASDPAHNYSKLYWVDVDTDELRRIELDGTLNQPLVNQSDGTGATGPRSVTVDDVNGHVYWTNNNSSEIWRANLDGSSAASVLTGLTSPIGIAVDPAGEKIYWFDAAANELWRADIDGSNAAALITTDISNPKALAIDATGGKIYWTNNGASSGLGEIKRADLDGGNIETITSGLFDPFGIALDTVRGKVYWAEPGLDQIHRADMAAGVFAETVVVGLDEPRAVAVDALRGKLYWADAGTDRIECANLDGSAVELVTGTGQWPTAMALGPPTQNLTYTITSGNTNGAFALDPVTGALSVANSSELDFETTAAFNLMVTVTDAGGHSDTATVTITITPVNDNDPVADNESFTVAEGGTATQANLDAGTSLLDGDTDADLPNDTLTVNTTALSGPSHGSLTLNSDGTFSYTHDGTENFSDSFTYELLDADGGISGSGTVTITITPVNDNDPVADNESFTVAEGGTATQANLDAGTSLLDGDTDADLPNDTLTVNTTALSGPSHGSLTLNSDGTFSYTHDGTENFSDSFTYELLDADGGISGSGTVTITITPVNDNDPVADNESFTVAEGGTATQANLDAGTSLLDGDTDADLPNDTLTVNTTALSGPSHGSLTLNSDGTFSYTHDGTENFSDSFTYELLDADGGISGSGTVTITITPVNDNDPVADNESFTVVEGGTATQADLDAGTSLLDGDTDVDLPNDTLTVNTTPVSGPSHGTLTLNADGTFSYTHDGSENFTDSFTYELRDADGGIPGTATVTITITPVNDNDPVADNESFTVAEGGTATEADLDAGTSLLDGDTDVDLPNDTLTVNTTPLAGPSHGSLTLNADGTFSYTHDGTENFTDSFTYELHRRRRRDTGHGHGDDHDHAGQRQRPGGRQRELYRSRRRHGHPGRPGCRDQLAGRRYRCRSAQRYPDGQHHGAVRSEPRHPDAQRDGTFSYTHDGTENFTDSFTYELLDADGGYRAVAR